MSNRSDDIPELAGVATYADATSLEQVLAMGVVEGASAAIAQIDDLLAATPAH